MANITRHIQVPISPDAAWQAVRDVGNAHIKLFPRVLRDIQMDGAARNVTFANGMVLRELIVAIDEDAMRIAYSSVGGKATHHNSSLQVFADHGGSRIVWCTDFLPDELAPMITGLVEMGAKDMQAALGG